MTFELTYHLRKDNKTFSEPSREHLLEAYRVLREEDVYVADLRNVQTGELLQLVTLDAGDSVGVAMFPFGDTTGALYSESDALTVAQVLAICEVFMTSGNVHTSAVAFRDKDWFERSEVDDSALVPLGPRGTIDELGDHDVGVNEERDPQEVINLWLQDTGYCTQDLVQWALDAGARFEAFTPAPPLIHISRHGRHADAIEFLLSLGEDIGASYDGGTALWHAINNSNYCFADELLLRGAQLKEARSSKNFSRWQKRDERSKIFEAIAAGHEHAVEAYLEGRPARQVPIDLFLAALMSDQLPILKRLLSHRGKLSVTSAHWESLWGRAMAKSDVRYLQALIDHGVYESVSALPEYGGLEFLYATPEALSFLLDNGYTAGFDRGFMTISCSNNRRVSALLATFPNHFFCRLSAEQLANAVLSFQQFAPERLDTVLQQNDYASLLHFIFHGERRVTAYQIMPAILGLPFMGPDERYAPSFEAERHMRAIGEELSELAREIM